MNNVSLKSIKALAASLALCASLFSGAFAATMPSFVEEGIYAPNAAQVQAIVTAEATDLVVLDGGLEQGLRCGMYCRVERANQTIGEIIIIASNNQKAAGLILGLVEAFTIQAGDIARIKTIQNS
jgi:hypothetical protein